MEKGQNFALADFQNGASTVAMLHRENNEIPIRKGVRQGDTISPKFLQKLWKIYSVALIGGTVVFQSIETNFRI